MRAAFVFLLLAATALPAQISPTAPAPASMPSPLDRAFDPVLFLLGNWSTKGPGPGQAGVEYTFHTDLNGTVITRTTTADTCVAPQAFDCQHHDLLTIYREPEEPGLRALYLDADGRVIHYEVTTPGANTAVFLSKGVGPASRLTYHLEKGVMSGRWQVAEGKVLQTKLEWSGGHPERKAGAAAAGQGAGMASALDALKGTTRVLLVFAPSSGDVLFRTEMTALKEHAGEMMERNLILVPVLGKWSAADTALYDQNLPFTVDTEQEAARNRFKIAPNRFAVILVGTDGGEKLRSRTPVEAKNLFDTIDAMPMRQQEMHTHDKERKMP